ncbi:MAG: zf-HC2 domain-containing protein [Anaerolineales bacterium]|nr:zf-HC2 domain-containing protein [Anaerolineales bacterium]
MEQMMFDRLFKSEHQRVAEMLSAYLDGELLPKEQARVEKHLARCADCAQNLHTLRQTVALLGQLPPVAVPRSFAIRPVPAAPRPSLFQMRRTYVYLRASTAVATILLAVVLAGDAFFTGLAPARQVAAPAVEVVREVEVEKAVVETVVVEKEVAVEKQVVETVVVEKEVAVEAPIEAPVVESESAYVATPSPAPAEDKGELVLTPKPLPTPAMAAKGIETAPAAVTPSTPEGETLAEAPPRRGEERIEATTIPTTLPADAGVTAEPAFTPTAMPTAVAEVLPSTPLPQELAAARPSRLGLVLWRVVEAGLLSLVLVLAIATLVAKRRQNIGWR